MLPGAGFCTGSGGVGEAVVGVSHEETVETIRVRRGEVIPEFDTDPRMRCGKGVKAMVSDSGATTRPFDSSKVDLSMLRSSDAGFG
jgi:hypothetical protein